MSSDIQADAAETLPCPRCDSRDTKFCYYNNYSTAQPRHFCKNCKRYWTAGGSLRNVPVGGGLRKSKKSKLSKHGKDLLSASAEEFLSPAKQATSLLLESPSSSADGAVDEAFANPKGVPLLAYRPSLDFATGSLDVLRDCSTPLPSSHSFDYLTLTQINSEDHGKGLHQLAQDVRSGGGFLHQPQEWYGSVDQAHSNFGEISLELSQEQGHGATVPSNMHSRYSAIQWHSEYDRREFKVQAGLRQCFEESRISSEQGNVQCFGEDPTFSQDGNLRNISPKDDDDEGFGNVINVRHPYDWEQVSEVLFGGTPDFFQMPTNF